MSYSRKRGSIWAKWLNSGKVVVFGKVVVLGLNWLYSGKNGFIREKRLYTGKSDCRLTATVTSLIKHFKESGFAPETMLRTQRSRPLLKPEKWLIFDILAKRDPMKFFWKASILQIAESDIFYVK